MQGPLPKYPATQLEQVAAVPAPPPASVHEQPEAQPVNIYIFTIAITITAISLPLRYPLLLYTIPLKRNRIEDFMILPLPLQLLQGHYRYHYRNINLFPLPQ